jgi:hypothetical protein
MTNSNNSKAIAAFSYLVPGPAQATLVTGNRRPIAA